jgi:hypothetical protein
MLLESPREQIERPERGIRQRALKTLSRAARVHKFDTGHRYSIRSKFGDFVLPVFDSPQTQFPTDSLDQRDRRNSKCAIDLRFDAVAHCQTHIAGSPKTVNNDAERVSVGARNSLPPNLRRSLGSFSSRAACSKRHVPQEASEPFCPTVGDPGPPAVDRLPAIRGRQASVRSKASRMLRARRLLVRSGLLR